MSVVAAVGSVSLICMVLLEAFETMLLPRRVTRHFRFTRLFYLYSWTPWAAAARDRLKPTARDVSQSLRSALDPGALRFLGGRADLRLCPLALVAREHRSMERAITSTLVNIFISAASRFSRSALATSLRESLSGGFWRLWRRGSGSDFSRSLSVTCRSCIKRFRAAR